MESVLSKSPAFTFACYWKGKPAVLGIDDAAVHLFSGAAIGSSRSATFRGFSATCLEPTRWNLTFNGQSSKVVFHTPPDGVDF